ncbi:hypothetical protein AB0F20_10140 [Streptomyces goshikiensis]|uniref:hypothetical protein n=1 Tax=Streptomyces goshikiensis TaxID=1942 RepID=UPI003408F1AC
MSRRSPDKSPRRGAPALRSIRSVPTTLVAVLLTPLWLILTAPPAQAIPGPCDIPGISEACDIKDAVGAVSDFVSDPIGFLAKKVGEGAAWFLSKIIGLMDDTTKVDFTNPGFLKQYALIFGVSTLLTVILWLVAVAKRAIAGVSIGTAVAEAVGLLVLQVAVNAFTPAVLVLLTRLVDQITLVFAGGAIEDGKAFIEKLTKLIVQADVTNAPIVLLIVFLMIILAALLIWIELLIRAGALYIGAAIGPLVNAGLVDRDLWGRSKKWAGMIAALLLSKPVLFALFGLAAAIMNTDTNSGKEAVNTLLVGALLLFLAVFSSASIYKWLPGFGDQMGSLMATRKAAGQAGPAAAVPGPAQAANSAMNARMTNAVVGKSGAGASGASAAAGPAAAAAAVAKAGMDMAKNKAQGADTIADQGAGDGSGPEPGGTSGGGGTGTPSSTPSPSSGGDGVVPVAGQGAQGGAEGGEGGESSSPAGSGTANPSGSSVVPSDTGTGAGEESSSSGGSSGTSHAPGGPSTIPMPSVPAGGPAPAGPSGTTPSAPAAPASSGQSGTSARAVAPTVPTPPAPSTPAAPARPIPGGNASE